MIFEFSIHFSSFELYMDRTIHICSYVELYMDRTIHICSHVDAAGGRRGSRWSRGFAGGSPGVAGGRGGTAAAAATATSQQLSHLVRALDHHAQGPNIPFGVNPSLRFQVKRKISKSIGIVTLSIGTESWLESKFIEILEMLGISSAQHFLWSWTYCKYTF